MRLRVSGRFVAIMLGVAALSLIPGISEAQGVLFVEGDKVGIGVATPSELLHVEQTTPGNTFVYVENSSGPERVGSRYQNSLATWDFRMDGVGDFIFDNIATAGEELKIRQNGQVRVGPAPANIVLQPNGNIDIAGVLTEGSSRAIKTGFEPVDSMEILAAVTRMPMSFWTYKADDAGERHLGPMAEDFFDAFGLGRDNRHISPSDKAGVALAAIQGLTQLVQEKDAEISDLRARLEVLEATLANK